VTASDPVSVPSSVPAAGVGEQSSTTTSSMGEYVCSRTLSTASRRYSGRSYVGTTTLTSGPSPSSTSRSIVDDNGDTVYCYPVVAGPRRRIRLPRRRAVRGDRGPEPSP